LRRVCNSDMGRDYVIAVSRDAQLHTSNMPNNYRF
jgi:hypothetical protein